MTSLIRPISYSSRYLSSLHRRSFSQHTKFLKYFSLLLLLTSSFFVDYVVSLNLHHSEKSGNFMNKYCIFKIVLEIIKKLMSWKSGLYCVTLYGLDIIVLVYILWFYGCFNTFNSTNRKIGPKTTKEGFISLQIR